MPTALQSIRTTVRENRKAVIDGIIREYYNLNGSRTPFCMFCGKLENLTREHVLPRWTFQGCPEKYFTTSINGQRQTYNKTTVPACRNCNGVLLNGLEKRIVSLLGEVDLNNSYFDFDELQDIIRWLEIIEYKLQVTGFIRRFIKSAQIPFNDYLSRIPLSLYRTDLSSDSKIISELRFTLKRISLRSKTESVNSLLIAKSKNKGFHFFHSYNNYIFLELPQYKIALFYFLSKKFETENEAKDEALKIIKKVY